MYLKNQPFGYLNSINIMFNIMYTSILFGNKICHCLLVLAELENMAPDQVGPDEDTGVTALSNCGATMMNTTVFVTVPASPFPVRVSYQRKNDNYDILPK